MAPEGPRSLTEGDDLDLLCGPAESGPVVQALSREANRAGGSGALPWWKGTEGTVGAAGGEEPGAEEAGRGRRHQCLSRLSLSGDDRLPQ